MRVTTLLALLFFLAAASQTAAATKVIRLGNNAETISSYSK
jgi:conjugal transfer/entry exclusion protein